MAFEQTHLALALLHSETDGFYLKKHLTTPGQSRWFMEKK